MAGVAAFLSSLGGTLRVVLKVAATVLAARTATFFLTLRRFSGMGATFAGVGATILLRIS